MGRLWDADVDISEERARDLIERQFPALAPSQLELLGIGWDNAAFRVNDHYVFRFPRRKIAAALIEREARVLPLLSAHLPLPIPTPDFVGKPEGDYPYPFAGYPFLPGVTACQIAWMDEERTRTAEALAGFLSALHRIPIEQETRLWAPGDDIERANLQKRAPKIKERLTAIAPQWKGRDLRPLQDLVDQLAVTSPSTDPPCWVHGDLYARHLLVDATHRLGGVIDWGDVHLGDPAVDLSIAYSFLPPEARATFRKVYGPADEATWDRARFRALHYGAVLMEYGSSVGDDAILAIGEYALQAAAE